MVAEPDRALALLRSDVAAIARPAVLDALLGEARQRGFQMSCDVRTGALLRTLVASKPGRRVLELGTGVGVSAAWLLDGMDAAATLTSVDVDGVLQAVARRRLGLDPRVTFVTADGEAFLAAARGPFDLVFADAVPGKFRALPRALDLLAPGGLYIVDDLLPQPTWPAGHQPAVDALLEALGARRDLRVIRLAWSTGLLIAVRGA